MAEPTIFTAFMAMMDDLGITPPVDERDPYGHRASSAVMMALEKVKDFPLDRLPEMAQYARDNDVRKASTIIREMSAWLAQGKLKEPEAESREPSFAHLNVMQARDVVAITRAEQHIKAVEAADPALEHVPSPFNRCTPKLHREIGCPLADLGIFRNASAKVPAETKTWAAELVKEGFVYS